jgi:hypothetical protein
MHGRVWSVIETHLHQTGSKKAASANRNEAAGFVGMQSGARVKVLKTLELMKGVAPLYSAWKSPDFPMFSGAILTFLRVLAD